MTKRALLILCISLCYLWFPYWYVSCNEENLSLKSQAAQNNDDGLIPADETTSRKEEIEQMAIHEKEEFSDTTSLGQVAEDAVFEECTHEEKDKISEQVIQVPLVDRKVNDLDKAALNLEASVENISSSSTSEISSDPLPNAIENSSAATPVVSSSEIDQSEPDCDIGGSIEVDPQNDSSFISPPASLVDQHVENGSIQHNKRKVTASQLEEKVPSSVSEQEKQKLHLNSSDGLEKEKTDQKEANVVDPTATGSPKDPVDIPTFDEWKKQVMEVEKEKSQSLHPSSNGRQHSVKVQKNQNNYASVECGAKILSANPEAKSTSAILIENMDLYMLNPCSTKIWFVIELCEPIQVKQLDIANYELFSSTPRDFLVSISDRYPTNKWVKLGTFHARDERTVQSFPLDEQMYAKYVKMFIKYIKVELISHFGSEHFCPLSLIRVFGTSMVEEYEEIVDSQYHSERQDLYDEDEDYPMDYNTRDDKSSKNLLGSATNAILSMVNNLAANMLGANTEEENTEGKVINNTLPENVTAEEPDNDTIKVVPEQTIDPTLRLETESLSPPTIAVLEPEVPKENPIVQLVQEEEEEPPSQSTVTLLGKDEEEEEVVSWFEFETQIYCSELATICCISSFSEYIFKWCSAIVDIYRQRSKTTECKQQERNDSQSFEQFLASPTSDVQTSSEHVLSVPSESKMTEEATTDFILVNPTDISQSESLHKIAESVDLEPSHTQAVSSSVPLEKTSDLATSLVLDAKNTDTVSSISTLTSEVLHLQTNNYITESLTPIEKPSLIVETSISTDNLETSLKEYSDFTNIKASETLQLQETSIIPMENELEETQKSLTQTVETVFPTEKRDEEQAADDASLNASMQRTTDFYAELQNATDLGYTNGNQVHGSNQKESVFMRLNNRIKALEVNMSLSSRYLEELSQRYRKQMEEMQRAFNKTILKLQNNSRIAEEQDQRQTESIQLLQAQLINMTQLVFNLSEIVNELKLEVSDRQSYLIVSLILCIILGLYICLQRCRNTSHFNEDDLSKIPKSNNYPSPKRCFSSYDDMNLKRRTTYPLIRSQSFQMSNKDVAPDDFYIVEPLKFSPEKKKKRCKYKSAKIETLKPLDPLKALPNGDIKAKKDFTNQRDFSNMGEVYHSSYKGPPSDGSSETSSQSEESYFCGITTCTTLCNGQPQKTKTEKRAIKRRRSKLQDQGKFIKTLIQTKSGSMPSLHDIIKTNKDLTVGTFGVTTISGHL